MSDGTKRFYLFKTLFFLSVGGKNHSWKKKRSVGKTNVGWRISPAKMAMEMSGHSLECKTEKRQRREKTPLGPIGRKKIICWLGNFFFVGWATEMSVGKNASGWKRLSTGGRNRSEIASLVQVVTFMPFTPKVPGSNSAK